MPIRIISATKEGVKGQEFVDRPLTKSELLAEELQRLGEERTAREGRISLKKQIEEEQARISEAKRFERERSPLFKTVAFAKRQIVKRKEARLQRQLVPMGEERKPGFFDFGKPGKPEPGFFDFGKYPKTKVRGEPQGRKRFKKAPKYERKFFDW